MLSHRAWLSCQGLQREAWHDAASHQAYGMLRLPVSSRMGLGAWQAACAALGSWMKCRTRRQKAVPLVSPWRKSNAPGPALRAARM